MWQYAYLPTYILINYRGKLSVLGAHAFGDRCGFYGDQPSLGHVIRIVRRYVGTYHRAKHISVTRAFFEIYL